MSEEPSIPRPGCFVSGTDGSRAWIDELARLTQDTNHYLAKVRARLEGVPLPTLQQTGAFVEHVITNHSWYKHLPHFPPGCWFLFALNPNAGCQFAWWESPPRHVYLARGSYFDHHSRLSTTEYRTRFGVWDYADLHARIQDLSFWPSTLPIHSGCRFTSFLRPHPAHGLMMEQRVEEDLKVFEEYGARFPGDSDVLRYRTLEAIIRQKDIAVGSWSDPFQTFIREEGRIQQDRLRDTLFRLREEWIGILGRDF